MEDGRELGLEDNAVRGSGNEEKKRMDWNNGKGKARRKEGRKREGTGKKTGRNEGQE